MNIFAKKQIMDMCLDILHHVATEKTISGYKYVVKVDDDGFPYECFETESTFWDDESNIIMEIPTHASDLISDADWWSGIAANRIMVKAAIDEYERNIEIR